MGSSHEGRPGGGKTGRKSEEGESTEIRPEPVSQGFDLDVSRCRRHHLRPNIGSVA